MEVYDQFIAPTRVTHSLSCHFHSLEKKTLVVVKNTLLQLFSITSSDKLIFIGEFKLNGQVIDIRSVRLRNSKYDQLLVLTHFAKLSMVSFDFDNNSIQTNSLHFYEPEFQKRIVNRITTPSILRVDPNNYTSLVLNKGIMGFLPFKQDDDDADLETLDPHSNGSFNANADKDVFSDSIIIQIESLEPSIHNIIDCDFLFNYRDPTLGVLYNKSLTWAGDLSSKKDTASFVVLSLDLTGDASTPIVNIDNLPYDLWYVKPLPAPINGTLLIGCNELIHVDNSGNLKGIGVNQYFQDCTDVKLEDRSELNLFLEDCKVEVFSKSNLLLVDQYGSSFNLNFQMDGKLIKGLKINKIETELPLHSILSITAIKDLQIFIGAGSSDALLINIESQNAGQQHIEVKKDPKKQPEDEDEDIYGDDGDESIYDTASAEDLQDIKLTVSDFLVNTGPSTSLTLGQLSPEPLNSPNASDVSIITTSGEGKQGHLTIFNPTIKPIIHSTLKFNNISKTWNVLNKYLVTTDLSNFKSEIFLINDNFKNFQSLDFKNNNVTINIETLFANRRILQITSTNVYLFDLNFKKLFQMNFDFEVLNGKIFDPFVIITSTKGEIKIFEIDVKGKKFNRVKVPKSISDIIITFGTISSTKILNSLLNRGLKRKIDDEEPVDNNNTLFLVSTVNNQILAFEKNHSEKVYHFDSINKLTEISKFQIFENEKGLIPDPFIKEIELIELGDEHSKDEVLIILTVGGELIIYKKFKDSNGLIRFKKIENSSITGAPENIYSQSTIIERKLIKMSFGGKTAVFITGKQPYIIYKSSKADPKIFRFTSKPAISFCKITDKNTKEDGEQFKFMYIDDVKTARIFSLPFDDQKYDYSNNWQIERFYLGQTVNNITFHETSKLVIVSTFEEVPYIAIDEEGKPIVGTIDDKPKAKNFKSYLKLLNPANNWSIIDQIELEEDEVINDIRSISLTISSRSKKKREFVIFGVGKYRMEDLSVYGSFHIYDIISIVPDPTKPDINFKFKEIFKEVVKGAVTSVTEISGRFLVSQGQKVIIRDLQQDNSTVPVAFYDTATFVSEAKSFGNLLLIGDSLKSIWFLGFDAEPFRLLLFGKDIEQLNITSADFIVDNGDIYFLVGDDESNLHLLTYQPDDAKSLAGQRLLKRSTFKTNNLITKMKMIQKHEEFNSSAEEEGLNSFQIIGVGVDGSLFKMLPISESSYRRLYILQQQLCEKLSHYCGLNPKSNRFSDNEIGAKPIIEFDLIRSFVNLNVDRRKQFAAKVGRNAYLELWKDFIEIENSLKHLYR